MNTLKEYFCNLEFLTYFYWGMIALAQGLFFYSFILLRRSRKMHLKASIHYKEAMRIEKEALERLFETKPDLIEE